MFFLVALLIVIYAFFYAWLEKKIRIILYKDRIENLRSLEKIFSGLLKEEKKLDDQVGILTKDLEATINLYEITNEVCKTLDKNQVFEIFRDRLKENINISDCLFLPSSQINLPDYQDDYVFRVKIDSKIEGFLIARGLKEQQDKDRFIILAQQFLLGFRRAMLYHQVEELSITDSLTRLLNRRYFIKRLSEEIIRSQQFKLNFSFLMADIDNFKEYNDRFGHLVGDIVLREVSSVIQENTRQIDLVGRYGGEEFTILLPETTKDNAQLAAERIRTSLNAKKIKAYDEELKVTISIGLCSFPDDAQTSEGVIDISDSALYEAKSKGKNQVCIYNKNRQ